LWTSNAVLLSIPAFVYRLNSLPDLLYSRELEQYGGPDLVKLGLRVEELTAPELAAAQGLRGTHPKLSLPTRMPTRWRPLLGIASWQAVLAQCEAASATAPRTISAFRTPGMEAIEAQRTMLKRRQAKCD
jgi:hypothetical protein